MVEKTGVIRDLRAVCLQEMHDLLAVIPPEVEVRVRVAERDELMIAGGGMALVSVLFTQPQRKRIMALHQGTWMIAQLMGPAVGGAFAEIGWWRCSFWVMVPVILGFAALAWLKIPEGPGKEAASRGSGRIPFLRLGLLTGGVFAVALAGPVFEGAMRVLLIVTAVVLVVVCLRLDRRAENPLADLLRRAGGDDQKS